MVESPYFLRSSIHRPHKKLKHKKSELHASGYEVFRGAIDISEKIESLAKKSADKQASIVFNHNQDNKRNDRKRRQCNLPIKTQYMQKFDAAVKDFVKSGVSTDLKPTDPVVLHSRANCQKQAPHCDHIPDVNLKSVSDDYMPLAMVISLMPETKLRVWPKSARLSMKDPDEFKGMDPIVCQELTLNAGDIVVFRGDFIHAGSAYEKANYRIHYYLDSPLVPRVAGRTWLIGKHACDELRDLIRPEAKSGLTLRPA